MKRVPIYFVAGLAACGGSMEKGKSADETVSAESGTAEVKVSAAADVNRVAAGQEFLLAARFAVAPGWHIYWENPGETGLATKVEFDVPAGFVAGPAMLPGPERFESPGGIVSYGYKDEVWVSTVVKTPDSLGAAEYPFAIRASWLACRESCVPGKGEISYALKAASAEAPSQAVQSPGLARHKSALPRPIAEAENVKAEWKIEGKSRILVLSAKGGERLEYFPSPSEQIQISGQALMPDEEVARLYVTYKNNVTSVNAGGVLRVDQGERVSYYRVNLESK